MTAPGLPAAVTVLERGWLSSNNILLQGLNTAALIDSGYATHSTQTLMLVRGSLGDRPLDRLLNTHLHSDHVGGNAALQDAYPSLRTSIPAGEAASVACWDEDALSFRATGQICPKFQYDDVLRSGEEVTLGDMRWEIHGAPGHDPHSIIFFEPASRTLISADALWENGFGVVFPELLGEPSFGDVAATLDQIEKLDPLFVIPGHGRGFSGVAQSLATARRRLDRMAIDPPKHAWHAAKVLMKFKLLEVQSISESEWTSWVARTPYIDVIRARFFPDIELPAFTDSVLDDLVTSGAIRRASGSIQNGK